MFRLLIIDDDTGLCASLVEYFRQFELELLSAHTPSQGLALIEQQTPDLLLLDVMMPETDGFTLCQQIRQSHSFPIIMLTARGQLEEKVHGLELGADDYLAKPFEPRELVARVQVLLRRLSSATIATNDAVKRAPLQFSDITIFPDERKVEVEQQEVSLTGMEFSLLLLLAENPSRVFNRDQLINELKGIEVDLYSRSMDILLSRLRQKLKDSAQSPRFIKTLRNVGYTFVAKPL